MIKSIEPRFYLGEILALDRIATMIKHSYGADVEVKNGKVKSVLIDYFDEKICFVYPKEKRKSLIFHCCKVQAAETQYFSIESFRDSLKDYSFDLDDKFCDENDIKTSWENSKIPQPFLRFLSKLFNFEAKILAQSELINVFHEDSKKKQNLKLLKIKSLFQNLYFLFNNEVKKTPQHTLIGLWYISILRVKILSPF